ncbi:MAG: AI-2E family transporter [Candidatus Adiutrix sp.]|jgi:predicted PurR-regulated permease PerM|nr:AI-2E family transporter [Candidatus Adiutrix sp.]
MRFAVARRRSHRGEAAAKVLPVFLFLAVGLIIAWLLAALKFIFLPMLLALFGAFLLNPPVDWLHRRGLPRPLAVLAVVAAAAVVFWLGGQYISASFVAFHDGFPKYEERIQDLIGQARALTDRFPFLSPDRLREAANEISLSGLVGNTLNSFVSVISYVLITLIFLMYFLPALPGLPEKIRRAFPDERGPVLRRAVEGIGRQVQSYVWAKTFTSVITGLGVTGPCLFFGVDFAVTWGVFAALLNFVPTIGAFLSVIPPVLVCWLQPDLGGLSTALWLAGLLVLVMVLTGNVLEPLMLGQSVNLSPTASLLAIFLWGWLWGAVGMLIAVPAMAMIKLTCDNIESLKPVGVLLGN